MDRRGFLRSTGMALFALPIGGLLIQACAGDGGGGGPADDTPAAPPTISGPNAEYTSATVEGHSHTFDIALTAFAAPASIQGQTSVDDGHSHAVSVTTADLQQVGAGQTVTVTTATSDGHAHVLTLVKIS
jgi:hypothetical protein